MPDVWKKLHAERVANLRIFDLLRAEFESPRTGRAVAATILEAPAWVNVIPLTASGECVLIKQFRFGTEQLTWEIPGGMVDPGEAPLTAASRELREETGYAAQRWTPLGSVTPNPAYQNNRLFMFLAEGCERVGEPEPDPGEDIEVALRSEAQVDALIASGELDHALVLVAFHKLALLRRDVLQR
ncbi:MAG TPA: NUDIX hydrolase [Polyangiales bacterium]|nr:NUDIX hydrolase [Polyangiales bacterium]